MVAGVFEQGPDACESYDYGGDEIYGERLEEREGEEGSDDRKE